MTVSFLVQGSIYVVTTECGDDERAFIDEKEAHEWKVWLEHLSEEYGMIQIKEMYLYDN
jgi:hypothetical protein